MRLRFVLSFSMAALLAVSLSYAKTPDGVTPAEEGVCNGLPGALQGLCVSYCEAMDCHLEEPRASERACQHVSDNYAKHGEKLGYSILPPCLDRDEDGVDDVVDNCPDLYNPEQHDEDGNDIGDECEEEESGSNHEPPAF